MRFSAIVGEVNFTDSMLLKGIDFIFRGLLMFNSPSLTDMDNGIYNNAVPQSTTSAPAAQPIANGDFA